MAEWKHDLFSLDNPKACAASFCCPCIQAGLIENGMGKNFLFGCAMACCLPLCSTVVQRQAVAKHAGISSNLVEDIALSCCCSCCVMTQCTQEIGEKADISNFKMEMLTTPPSKQEIEAQAKAATSNATAAKTENPLAAK